jgi:hypothetical protein
MSENPYSAPASNVDDGAPHGVNMKVALLAGCAGVGAAFTAGSVYSPFWQYWLLSSGVSVEDLYYAYGAFLPVNVTGQIVDALACALSGYLAARYSSNAPLRHGAASTIPVYVVVVASHLGVHPSPFPLWSEALSLLLPLPCALFGAHRGRKS